MAIIQEVEIATTLTPQITVSTEKEMSPLNQALIEYLKPTFDIKTSVGDYRYAPYGVTGGSWIIPLLLLGLIWAALRR